MLQFGGHHLAINLTIGGSQASMTPSHTAAQPATYTIEGRTVRPLGAENDKAFALINALDDAQRSQADPELPRGRSRARAGAGWADHSTRGHPGDRAERRRSNRCCWNSCGNGPAS